MIWKALGMTAALSALVACGGTTITDGDAGTDAANDTQAPDAAPDNVAPFACGTTTCSGTEVCVHPCCGGAPPLCEAEDDAGVCPPGSSTTNSGFCPPQSPGPCKPDACKPPPEYCAPSSSNCMPNGGHDCYETCG